MVIDMKDEELVEFIESLFSDESMTWVQRWDAIFEWKAKHYGIMVSCARFKKKDDGSRPTPEEIGEAICRTELAIAKGELKPSASY